MKSNYWIRSPFFDLAVFHFSWIGLLPILVVYYKWGITSSFVLIGIQNLLFSIPHIVMTWLMIAPFGTGTKVRKLPILICLILAGGWTLVYLLSSSPEMKIMYNTVIYYLGVWHIIRQHQGICRIYDAAQTQRTSDSSLRREGFITVVFLGLLYALPLVHANSQAFPEKAVSVGFGSIYHLPFDKMFFSFYTLVCGLAAIFFVYRLIYLRIHNSQPLPVTQICLTLSSASLSCALYFVLPPTAGLLIFFILTSFHNIQYFGIFWLYQQFKFQQVRQKNASPLLVKRMLYIKNPFIFGPALLCTAGLLFVACIGKNETFTIALYGFVTSSHYLVDGVIWKNKNNPNLKGLIRSFVDELP